MSRDSEQDITASFPPHHVVWGADRAVGNWVKYEQTAHSTAHSTVQNSTQQAPTKGH